jgi:iron complex outermembrane receptor protein
LRLRVAQTNPDPPPLTFLLIEGSHDVQSEILHAYELGYRYEWAPKFSADATIYYNQYGRLSGTAVGAPIVNPSPPYVDLPEVVQSLDRGQTHGLELALNYTPFSRWTVSSSVTLLRGTSTRMIGFPSVANNPLQEYAVQSRLKVTSWMNLDVNWYHYDGVHRLVPLVNRADLGLSTDPWRGFSFSVWGRNLQQDHHFEGFPTNALEGEIRRSLTFKIVWEPHDQAPPAH